MKQQRRKRLTNIAAATAVSAAAITTGQPSSAAATTLPVDQSVQTTPTDDDDKYSEQIITPLLQATTITAQRFNNETPRTDERLPVTFFTHQTPYLPSQVITTTLHTPVKIDVLKDANSGHTVFREDTLQIDGEEHSGEWKITPEHHVLYTPHSHYTGVTEAGFSVETKTGSILTAVLTIHVTP